ncbi:hypothetical protein BKA66DRAFT_440228 [Pyrenochaeta sp. MPI-SDFR-AT-0127]|nr:hypothetical protein BKA66DRAFT_440228 [Pyrenochaeta sp. MPI-SDFR-AT-0127]
MDRGIAHANSSVSAAKEMYRSSAKSLKRSRGETEILDAHIKSPFSATTTTRQAMNADQNSDDDVSKPPPSKRRKTALILASNQEDDAFVPDTEEGEKSRTRLNAKRMRKPKKVYTPEEVLTFLEKTRNLKEWSSSNIPTMQVELIKWIDVDGISISDCAEKWVKEGYTTRSTVTAAAMYKNYDKYGPMFYKEKGIDWVSCDGRRKHKEGNKKGSDAAVAIAAGSSTPGVLKTKVPRSNGVTKIISQSVETVPNSVGTLQNELQEGFCMATGSAENRKLQQKSKIYAEEQEITDQDERSHQNDAAAALDVALEHAFSKIGDPVEMTLKIRYQKPNLDREPKLDLQMPIHIEVSHCDIDRFKANRQSRNVLSFKRKAGDAVHGHPSRPVLRRDCAILFAPLLHDILRKNPSTRTIAYGDGIEEATVHRFIACVSPTIRPRLPTHDLIEDYDIGGGEVISTQIQWIMHELQNLYMFAHCVGANDVCDMVIDRWHAELHRATPRLLYNEYGDIETFEILGYEPGFLNHLAEHDKDGFNFFSDLIIMKGDKGWQLLNDCGLHSWSDNVKTMLITKIESQEFLPVTMGAPEAVCSVYHHHGYEQKCYRSHVLATNPITDVKAPLSSFNRASISRKRPESVDPARRWKIQLAFTKKEQAEHRTLKRCFSDSSDDEGTEMHMQKKFKMRHESGNESDDEDGNSDCDEGLDNSRCPSISRVIALPDEYNIACHIFRMAKNADEGEDFIPYDNTGGHDSEIGRIIYPGKRMNGLKDGEEVAKMKLMLVERQLAAFVAWGYNLDDVHVDILDEMEDSDEDND